MEMWCTMLKASNFANQTTVDSAFHTSKVDKMSTKNLEN